MQELSAPSWPHRRCDVGLEAEVEQQNCLYLYTVHCNVYCCTIMLHNSTSSSNWSVDLIVSISLSLALSSKCLCNFLYLCHYVPLKFFHIVSFTVYRASFHEIDFLFIKRPFCATVLWHLFHHSAFLSGGLISWLYRHNTGLLCSVVFIFQRYLFLVLVIGDVRQTKFTSSSVDFSTYIVRFSIVWFESLF